MPDINEMRESSFVTKGDLGPNGAVFTIRNCEQVNVAKDGAPPEMKWALNLVEIDKPFIVNATNRQIIANFSGRTNTDHWGNVRTVIYFDPNVSFGGKLTGGLRCRAPRVPVGTPAAGQPAPTAAPANHQVQPLDEDVPFN